MRIAALVVLSLVGCKAAERTRQSEQAAGGEHVRLPRSAAGPVRRLCGVTPAVVQRLAAIEHADFDREALGGGGGLRVRHTTKTRPKLGVTVEIGACGAGCPGVGPALPESLRGRPETRFEQGVLDDPRFAGLGRPVRTQYALGASEGDERKKDPQVNADDSGRRTYLDAYTLYADDGVTWLRVTASYLDDAVGGVDRLLAIAPPEDLQKLATAFASFYLHECQ